MDPGADGRIADTARIAAAKYALVDTGTAAEVASAAVDWVVEREGAEKALAWATEQAKKSAERAGDPGADGWIAAERDVARECCVLMMEACEEVAVMLTEFGNIVGDPFDRKFDSAAASMRALLQTMSDKLGIGPAGGMTPGERSDPGADGVADAARVTAAKCALVDTGTAAEVASAAVDWMAEHEGAAKALTWATEQAGTKTGASGAAFNRVAGHEGESFSAQAPAFQLGEIIDASDGKILVGDTRCRLIAIHAGESIVGVPLGAGPLVSLRASRVDRVVAGDPAVVPTLLFGDVGDAKETVAVLSSAMLEKRMGTFMKGLVDMEKLWPSVADGIGIASGRVPRVVLERPRVLLERLYEHGPVWWSVRVAEGEGGGRAQGGEAGVAGINDDAGNTRGQVGVGGEEA